MKIEKYIKLVAKCCQKYGGIDDNGEYRGKCRQHVCPLENLSCGDFMDMDYNMIGEAVDIHRQTMEVLRQEFPEEFKKKDKTCTSREYNCDAGQAVHDILSPDEPLYDFNRCDPVYPHTTADGKLDYNAQIMHIMGELGEVQEAYDKWQRNQDRKSFQKLLEEIADLNICAQTLFVNATTPEEFRLAVEMVNCKNRLRQYGKADKGGGLA